MKNYTEEWTAVVNNSKYILNESQANLLKQAIATNNRGVILFPEFAINLAYLEEFYLSNKIYDKKVLLNSENEREITDEEKRRLTIQIAEFRRKFFKK